MVSAQLYALVSTLLFVSAITRVWISTNDFFEMWLALFEDPLSLLVCLNLLCVFVFWVLLKIKSFLIGELNESSKNRIFSEVSVMLVSVVLQGDWMGRHADSAYLFWSVIHVIIRAIAVTCSEMVEVLKISVVDSPFKHIKFFTAQIITTLLMFDSTMKWIALQKTEKKLYAVSGAWQMAHSTLEMMHGLCNHVVLLVDIESQGNSLHAYRASLFLDFLVTAALSAINVWGYMGMGRVSSSGMNLYVVFMGVVAIWRVYQKAAIIWNWIRMNHKVRRVLKPPTEEEAREMCIVCRSENSVSSSRVLPCGHCMHVDCLIRWLGTSKHCPMCQAHIVEALEQAEKEMQGVHDVMTDLMPQMVEEDENVTVVTFSELEEGAEAENGRIRGETLEVTPVVEFASEPVEQNEEEEVGLKEILEGISKCERELARLRSLVTRAMAKKEK